MTESKVSIIFLCVGNACRSQMAEGFARFFSATRFDNLFEIYSAGTHPAIAIPREVYEVMGEVHISLDGQSPKSIKDLPISRADYIVTMGCEVSCPIFPHNRHIEWEVEDPIGAPLARYREVRDQIRDHVLNLLRDIFEEHQTPQNL